MMSYASIIFRESGSTLSPSVSSIIIGAIQLVGAYIASMLVDRLGRKVRNVFLYSIILMFKWIFFLRFNQLLMVFSFAATGVCHLILGTYIFLGATTSIDLQSVQWIPVVSFSLMLFVACCGALPIPFVILSEMLPDRVRKYFPFQWKIKLIQSDISLNRFEASVRRSVCVYLGDWHLWWPKVFHQSLPSFSCTDAFIYSPFAVLLLSHTF